MGEVITGVCIIGLVLGANALVWGLIFLRMNHQAQGIRPESWRTGEMIILGPVRANYTGWNGRFGVSKTIGTLALLEHRLLFKRPLGPDISIPLDDIAEVSDTVKLGKRQIASETYVSLKLHSGSWIMFSVPDAGNWIDAINRRVLPA